jgi:hypothetical protein
MKRLLILFAVAAVCVAAGTASAGTQDGALVVLHAKNHTTKATTLCTTWKPTVSCSAYEEQWATNVASDVYLVVGRGNTIPGIAGLSCGIEYSPTVGMFGWTLCADLEFTNSGANGFWPASAGGNRITWVNDTNCQRTEIAPDKVHAFAGVFYVYAYGNGTLAVTPNNNLGSGPELAVADCSAATTLLPMDGSRAGVVGFGTATGYSPCAAIVPVEPTTWGSLKSKF